MRPIALYGTFFVLIAGALIFFTILGKTDVASEYVSSYNPNEHKSHESPNGNRPGKHHNWRFDYKRDNRNYGLSEEQCELAFPGLYKEIDRAVAHRLEKWGKITPDEVDVGWSGGGIVRAMIHNNQLYIVDPRNLWDQNNRPRAIATMHSIHRAISAYPGKLPDIEFSWSVNDFALHDRYGNGTTWAFSRLAHQEKLWLIPDFGMWAWPDVGLRSYAELREVLEHEEDEFVDKIPKLVWRGSLAVGSKDVRHGLVEHSEGKPWSAVETLDWGNETNIEERLITMQDHCSYMFVAQTEGNTYSGRTKYLLNCHSIIFSHDLDWIEFYHHLLKKDGPDQNYIRVKRDYSDLPSKMYKLTKPGSVPESKKIADNARRTFRERYLTPAAEACYWRALIRGWASVQGFTPEFWAEVTEFDKVLKKERTKRKPKGVPFEAYVIMEEVDWALPAKPRKLCIG